MTRRPGAGDDAARSAPGVQRAIVRRERPAVMAHVRGRAADGRRFTRFVRASPVTVGLAAVVSVVAVAQAASRGPGDLDSPTRWLGWSTHAVTRGQWWRLFTPNLVNPANNGLHVHSSAAAHYAFSLLGLVVLGIALERRIGWRWFLVTAFVSGLTAFTSLALTDPHGPAYDGGSSGIIAGAGGALVVLLCQHRRDSPRTRRWWWTAAAVVALLCFVSTTWSANVNQVHAVSFAAGAAIAAGLRSFRGLGTPARGIAVLLVVMSLSVAGIRTIEQPNPAPPEPSAARSTPSASRETV